ncbi:STAS domain-containing protein [Celeribacter sp.]|uniref:STAS domain-containing protein n=1 Tax=Celeribacter sp. TaxID=1890673 RepID=UPI003A941A17
MSTITLPERLDYQSMPQLLEQLKAQDADDLTLDAAAVRHLGTLPLQVLLSAIKTRAAAGKTTHLANTSDACIDLLSLFGFSPETMTQPETWK